MRFTIFMVCLLVCEGTRAGTPTLASPPKVNRTVPSVLPRRSLDQLSTNPGDEEIFRVHTFLEPLVPVGGKPEPGENAALVAALLAYAKRSGPDDFSGLTDFIKQHPQSRWNAALLTNLGIEYYDTAHYSLAVDAWSQAWKLGKDAAGLKASALIDRAVSELAYMYARLGRMDELGALLNSVDGRRFQGGATERIDGAKEGLWMMQHRPEVAFRCGPLALHRIKLMTDPGHPCTGEIFKSASTRHGFSLTQVAELSKEVGLGYQMAFRQPGGEFVVPSVVHWKVGHFAALVRRVGDRYLLQDPTFGDEVWATRKALEAETSGYFLIPPGSPPSGWRTVAAAEGSTVWGKGQTAGNDPGSITPGDLKTGGGSCKGMMVPFVHLMDVNLNLVDQPVGYNPPVGPPVHFIVRYNHRDAFQPGNFSYGNLGSKFTSDWFTYITDNPQNPLADVHFYVPGGGERTFTGFNTNSQTFSPQQYDRTMLTRSGPASYRLELSDGSQFVFGQSDGSFSTRRNIFLSQVIDRHGNAVTLTYDDLFRLVAITDAIGQVTTLTYGLPSTNIGGVFAPADDYKITKVTDPFGRSATFSYSTELVGEFITGGGSLPIQIDPIYGWQLTKITDVVGLTSEFAYSTTLSAVSKNTDLATDFIKSLVTPYGTTTFTKGDSGTTRWLETLYPDGSRERVEYNQTNNIPMTDPASSVPTGMRTHNDFLQYRNTYYWSRAANELAYGDHSKARLYHWLHTESLSTTSGALESTKEPLEGRVWYDYAGQNDSITIGKQTLPAHVGRVLDDGTTQLFTFGYDRFGHMTNTIDPTGRTLSFLYDTNGIDLLEIRQTRGGNNDLLNKATYNSSHQRLTSTDAAGQTTTYTYNERGQMLTVTNPKKETVEYHYDSNGYLVSVNGPLPGTNDVATITYDNVGRMRSVTGVDGYTLVYDYDDLDRLTRTTYPDGTFREYAYDRLDLASVRDRAGLLTRFEYDNMRHRTKKTDPLGRETTYDWCRCGALNGLTDPLGRTTSWSRDVQSRPTAKQCADGSRTSYFYENNASRLREVVDEQQQATLFSYYLDNTVKSVTHSSAGLPTPDTASAPDVSYTYDPNYRRTTSMSDGTGTTTFGYFPVSNPPGLGAGRLASVDGPLDDDTITYGYDETGRRTQTTINGVGELAAYDPAGRLILQTNAIGSFAYTYDGFSRRVLSESFPNGQSRAFAYEDIAHGSRLQQVSHLISGTPVSKFIYGYDNPRSLISSWSQQEASQTPSTFTFAYDAADQLTSVDVTSNGTPVDAFRYTYDLAGNRLTEQAGGSAHEATYNALNQLTTTSPPEGSRTNEWDAMHRLTAVDVGNQRTEFGYDGIGRLVSLRHLGNGAEESHRLFVWIGTRIAEERDAANHVVKRYFPQGMQLNAGSKAGAYYYARDHLGSIRGLTDAGGNVRARYSYDPFGRRTKLDGDVEADFGFAGMFWSPETKLALTLFRAYDPNLGRWLSRDPLPNAELRAGPNLYAYVDNNPVGNRDPYGLILSTVELCFREPGLCTAIGVGVGVTAEVEAVAPGLEPILDDTVECLPSLLEDSGAVDRLRTIPGIISDTISDLGEVAPQLVEDVEAAEEELAMTGPELEQWLVENGELGGNRFGPNALEAMKDFAALEQQFYEQIRGTVPVGEALEWAHQRAVEVMGFDITNWLK